VKSRLVSESPVLFNDKLNLILIRELEIRDPELFEIVQAQKESERIEFLKRSLKVGALALRDAVTSGKLDLIERKFQGLCLELNQILDAKLGKEGMEGELEQIFGKNGEFQLCLEKLFGDRGRLVRDILDMDNKNSPIGRLRERMESYFVGKDSEVYSMLDPNRTDSPMCRLRQEIMNELAGLKTVIERKIIEKEIIKQTTYKGFAFEDVLESFLLSITGHFGDIVQRVGNEKGKLRNQKGDFLISICDPIIEGQPPKIVIEAKAGEDLRLTQKGLLGELDECIENRDAGFAIAVTQSQISPAVGNYREIPLNKIVCAFGDDGLPLEVAYKVARTRLILNVCKEAEREIDVVRINGIIGKITSDLGMVQGIKAKLTSIGTTSETIKDDIKTLESSIRESLAELQDSVRSRNS